MAPGLLAAAVLAAVASLAAHVALNCPVQPVPSTPRPPTPPPNNLLQRLEKLGEGALDAPEDVYVDAAAGGTLYTATRDGWLQRMHPNNGSWERWRFVGGTGLLGVAPSADGTMLVCDADKGLLRVGEEGVTLLASEVEGSTIRFADAAIEASDGTVYFSDASTRFDFDRWFYDFLESHATGRLLRYDRRNGETSVVLDRLSCANGVALPRDETFVVVCETWRFSCMRVWLKGEKAGKAETFVDLPGAPDNIRLGSDGHFWIALHLSSPWLDFITRWTFTKRVVASLPVLLKWSKATIKGAMVAQVSDDGNVVRVLDDSEGKVINSVTSVTEFNGDIFLGSLWTNFVGKLSLAQVTQQEQGAVSS
ncbi:protein STRICTOSIDINE SYNTHASE-LIKE 4-like [Miscanthus floridulus]|uniref:protein STRICTOSIDINE SYNTHASE-LIKE 4-like n=1 Tax=Miscanthus floridulus TaxID=154761 RepID=UPI00345AF2A7